MLSGRFAIKKSLEEGTKSSVTESRKMPKLSEIAWAGSRRDNPASPVRGLRASGWPV